MYFLKGSIRKQFRKDARELIKSLSKKPISLALADPEMHDITYNTLKRRLSPIVTGASGKIPRNVSENAAFVLARALANRAYEGVLLDSLRKDVKSTSARMLAEVLGVKKGGLNGVIEESRMRLELAKKAEDLSARGLALLPKAFKHRGLYEERYSTRMDDAAKLIVRYQKSLNNFYRNIQMAKRRRELQ